MGAPKVSGQEMIIPVKSLPVFDPHPLGPSGKDKAARRHPALGWAVDGLLVFRGVSFSKRKMADYIGDPMSSKWNPKSGFGEDYEIIDINTSDNRENLNRYSFEGRLDEPPAVIAYWNIIARSFELQVE